MEGDMYKRLAIPAAPATRRRPRRRQAVPVAAAMIGLGVLATACSSGSPDPGHTGSSSGNHISSKSRPDNAQNQAQGGTFTVAFARCMRAHGVPKFPDPNGQSGQLGPGSGIDPNSPQFQSAVNGPCKSMAPPGWVSSGPVVAPGGGS
jgi:hypothetical protein